MAKQVFFDPQKTRWRRMRPIFDALAVGITLVFIVFVFTILRGEDLPALLLPQQKAGYRPYKEKPKHRGAAHKGTHRKTATAPSQVVLNQEEGIRAAFYVTWDAGSLVSLREYANQIDLLYPEWLHVLTSDGRLQALGPDAKLFDVVSADAGNQDQAHFVDDKVMKLLADEKADTEVFPLVNNFDPVAKRWIADLDGFLNSAQARATFRRQVLAFLATDKYRGLSLDFESFPPTAQPGFRALVQELAQDLHARGLKLYVNLPTGDNDFDYAFIAQQVDGIVLMDYDQHSSENEAGPVAAQEWFLANLEAALKVIPKEKIICGIGNYGYDWPTPPKGKTKAAAIDVKTYSVQEAWLTAKESEAEVELDGDTLNSRYAYLDERNVKHDVWFLDAVTALDQMRGAGRLGISTFALWRLGAEDRSLWSVWDKPGEADAPQKLKLVPPGHDVDLEGHGDILRIEQRPGKGARDITVTDGLITAQRLTATPSPYVIQQYGARQQQIVLSFDDGPDPRWTPQILDVLKREQAPAVFFLIGGAAQDEPSLMKRIYAEGHEIGNHTYTHPDISNISKRFMAIELNLTERLFAAKLGVKPLFFRPPYSIDQEPDVDEQVRPLEIVQDMGYLTVGSKIDPNDWKANPHRTAEEITASVVEGLTHKANLQACTAADPCGNIVLLHDGGGDRRETVRALPMIIHELRARGYQLVSVAELLGRTRAEVMPPISANERWSAQVDRFAFWLYGVGWDFIVLVFFVGDVLMTARLLFIGVFAIYDRVRGSTLQPGADVFRPEVAVLIPAYNEATVIERTVRAVLRSKYPHLRAIVIDDGSTDATAAVVRGAFAAEIAGGKVLLLTKANAGKAEALNLGLEHVQEEFFVGIDADTVVAAEAITRLVEHFVGPKVAAAAGNTKVGNRVNIWTRWQALEYITSQNFERRALNVFGAVSVVPGALGAWRTAAVREAGGYHTDTVAEDADLTMSLLERGYKVVYDDRALAFTEAPDSASGLMRQRFRWSFGILQAVWKHRGVFARRGTLGWIALPNIVVFQIMLPLVSPFIDVLYVVGALTYLWNKIQHPETANPATIERLTLYFVLFLVVDFIASAIAFSLERRETTTKKDFWLLSQVWLQRFAYRQLFSVVLFKTLKRALDGRPFNWDKLERTAGVSELHAQHQ
ncbi:MAG: glycosyltransferase [Acidobacteriota bacterium]|nr:glycosyltransferase [Acidobacteriota bacterium]